MHPDGIKMHNINPEIKVIDGLNRIIVINAELSDQVNYNIEAIFVDEDYGQMKSYMIGGQQYEVYKFIRVKSFKRIIVFNGKMNGQWPELHNAGNGMIYEDMVEMDKISTHLMAIWYPVMSKVFKIRLECTLIAEVEENNNCSIKELMKKIRKTFGLAEDCVLADNNGLVYQDEENALQYKKELWLARIRPDKTAKLSKFIDIKIMVENGEACVYIDTRVFSVWGLQAINAYLNYSTGLKNRSYIIEVNGTIWGNKRSLGSLKPRAIRIFPDQYNVIHRVISVVNLDSVNIHAINLKFGECYLNLTAPRNVPLGQAMAIWCLLGVNIPPFNYLQMDGRRLTDYEYKVELLDHWPWNKMFILMNNLKGGNKEEEEKMKVKNLYAKLFVTLEWGKMEDGMFIASKIFRVLI
jgi:hypothetical protein